MMINGFHAVHYFLKAVGIFEDDMPGPMYHLVGGLLRLAEGLAASMPKEPVRVTVGFPSRH